jgi:hypothetical protein
MTVAETSNGHGTRASLEETIQDLQRPHLFLRLVENTLTVAQSLQSNYFNSTARFVDHLRRSLRKAEPIIKTARVDAATWDGLRGEVVTFIDGGVGQAQIASRVPLVLRVGSYAVRTGERNIRERERFAYYPILLGELEGGSKDRPDFVDIVRITAELLGGLAALERTPDLRVLMFHGPLVYLVSGYAGHTPFTEADIDLFLHQYGLTPETGQSLKDRFVTAARLDIYPAMTTERVDHLADRRLFEPLAWMAFLYRELIAQAQRRRPATIVTGVVERGGRVHEFSKTVLLRRVFRKLRETGQADYFNKLFGRTDLTSESALLERLGYTDALLLGMMLDPGSYSEPWLMDAKYAGLRGGDVRLPGEEASLRLHWGALAPGRDFSFPRVLGAYLQVSETTEPLRIEVFPELGDDQLHEAASRVYLYARLLPGYGFPVGLDIADRFAHVPNWLTDAYGKMIKHHLATALQTGDISDEALRKVIVQAIYLTNRDWLFRPDA